MPANVVAADELAPAFLTAEWRYLLMLNYVVDPGVLQPYVPRGAELDTHDGHAYLSLVGFRFLHTRVLGLAAPCHRHFDEVNLRFYVRRETRNEIRRGVVFIREIVPRRAIAALARRLYNEPYLAFPMRSQVPATIVPQPGRVRYAWKSPSGWHHIAFTSHGAATIPESDSRTAFLAEHYWGYTRQRDGSAIEYRVTHTPWRVWDGGEAELAGNTGALYGPVFGAALQSPPACAFLAEGSAITVFRPVAIPG